MKETVKKILKITTFTALGIFLLWLVYRGQNFTEIWQQVLQADISYILLALFLGLLSHLSRAMRWNLLMEPLGYKPRTKTSFLSILIMYLANFAIPRSGEVVRCTFVNRYEKVPFSGLLGTVVIERIVDTLILFALTIFVIFTNIKVVKEFLANNPAANQRLLSIASQKWLWLSILAATFLFFVLLYIFRHKIKQTRIYQKFGSIIKNFADGIRSLWRMRRKWEFMAHSLFIWLMYLLMLYVMFFSFDFTKNLNFIQAITLLVMSSLGMLVPSPGGLGSWHFMTIQTLFIYGINQTQGKTFALVAHGSQMIFLVIVGLIALILISSFKTIDSRILTQNTIDYEQQSNTSNH